jgi:hypothetical protein
MQAGRHAFTWAASGSRGTALSSGVYFLEMTAGGVRRTQRFVVIGA